MGVLSMVLMIEGSIIFEYVAKYLNFSVNTKSNISILQLLHNPISVHKHIPLRCIREVSPWTFPRA